MSARREKMCCAEATRGGFSLIELLVVIVIVAVLVSLLLPALAHVRESGRAVKCLSNHRQIYIAWRAYADDHNGLSPALGEPYLALPNWALVVQKSSGMGGATPEELYSTASALVCPSTSAFYGRGMTRTYAANATGWAGAPGDRGNFDDPAAPAHVHCDRIELPARTPLAFDSLIAVPPAGNAPPPTRTASVLDLRNESHRTLRLGERGGRMHGSKKAFQFGKYDGSAGIGEEVEEGWLVGLP